MTFISSCSHPHLARCSLLVSITNHDFPLYLLVLQAKQQPLIISKHWCHQSRPEPSSAKAARPSHRFRKMLGRGLKCQNHTISIQVSFAWRLKGESFRLFRAGCGASHSTILPSHRQSAYVCSGRNKHSVEGLKLPIHLDSRGRNENRKTLLLAPR